MADDYSAGDANSKAQPAYGFPLILRIEQAAELLQVPVGTLRDWRSRGLLENCCRRRGKHLRFHRDRLLSWYFEKSDLKS